MHTQWFGLLTVARVEGFSMMPTLSPNDLVVAIKLRGPVHKNDVVLANFWGRLLIKRIQSVDKQTSSCILGVEQPYARIPLSWVTARVILAFRWREGVLWLRRGNANNIMRLV